MLPLPSTQLTLHCRISSIARFRTCRHALGPGRGINRQSKFPSRRIPKAATAIRGLIPFRVNRSPFRGLAELPWRKTCFRTRNPSNGECNPLPRRVSLGSVGGSIRPGVPAMDAHGFNLALRTRLMLHLRRTFVILWYFRSVGALRIFLQSDRRSRPLFEGGF